MSKKARVFQNDKYELKIDSDLLSDVLTSNDYSDIEDHHFIRSQSMV